MPEAQVYLGFDFGMQYIGVAVGQIITATATPLTILKAKAGIPDWLQLDNLVTKWQAQAFVVGLPYQLDGSEQHISIAARQFAQSLQESYQLQVHLVDERLTTKEAKIDLAQQFPFARGPQRIDNYAAKLILESWLRNQKQEHGDIF